MIQFTYFENPEDHCVFLDEETACDICGIEKKCLDADMFYGEETISAICPECLAAGKLNDKDIFTCTGDAGTLQQQLQKNHAGLPKEAIKKLEAEKTEVLEKTTPHLASWQDWDWPAADGDYCKFIGYGSKPLFNELAKDGNGEALFTASIYEPIREDSDSADLWEEMPEKPIKNYVHSLSYSTLFYVFRSLHGDTYVTLWDQE